MELNWTTFVLEILNFLVLVWLLQRILYKPVKDVIARRRQGIEEQLHKATESERRAEALLDQYQNRLADWEKERQNARRQLHREIEAEQQRLLAEMQRNIEAEKKKNEVLAARQEEERQRHCETRAMELGARFVAKLLENLRSAEMQARLIKLLLVELGQVQPEQRKALQSQVKDGKPPTVQVLSAYPVDETQQAALQEYLDTLVSHPLQYDYTRDPSLLAGIRLIVGPWVIHANLQDELQAFVTIANEKLPPRR